MNYDVFNGDADGIIALLQLRLANPLESQLVTGVKRDIKLLQNIDVNAGDTLTVLDISMEKNIDGLNSALEKGASVFYADHHRCGEIPEHEKLDANIDLDANTCTGLIIDKLLDGKFHAWAITAAYGDNLIAKADDLCLQAGYSVEQAEQLKELGTLINYNGYGATVADLHFDPATLYQALLAYPSPFDLLKDLNSPFYKLQKAYGEDIAKALAVPSTHQSALLSIFELPDETWSRRISGVYGNLLANQNPDSAHAVLTKNKDESYLVSLRAPLNNKQGAGDICSKFATGGGRAAAAGINALNHDALNTFIELIEQHYRH
ncbi:DHHA1 domain-containing protein [Psychromonas sp. Urea-02u-13]|uniref:DHHA1 domain-containing protein n=1 Tax=Psychromonas sp. Urea-02u-13 TaxID=2058326 RepID=UPI000C34F46E|nr:acetyltransferase [Psychromonas sp. Urea-02u-13]PKG38752.1 acetyltransferase [Psychromonas sp. Urea-02u-13]